MPGRREDGDLYSEVTVAVCNMKKASHSRLQLKKPVAPSLRPRKQPVQSRSEETVRAICEATVQVLLLKGSKLTTTEVAHRAGVSVGTLYQYFPNKAALLHSIMSTHLEHVTRTMEETCLAQREQTLPQMAAALVGNFIEAKLHDGPMSVALYAVADALDSKPILQKQRVRFHKALVQMLQTAPGVRFPQLETTAMMVYAAMAGSMRMVLEAGAGKALVASTRSEMTLMVEGHLMRASVRVGKAARVA
jgi:AcrR family transcriptional regulator